MPQNLPFPAIIHIREFPPTPIYQIKHPSKIIMAKTQWEIINFYNRLETPNQTFLRIPDQSRRIFPLTTSQSRHSYCHPTTPQERGFGVERNVIDLKPIAI